VEHVEGTDESTVDKDSSVPLVHHDVSYLISLRLIQLNLGHEAVLNNPNSSFDKGKIKPV